MAKVFITGLGGFVGPYLADFCLKKGDEVAGTVLSGQTKPSLLQKKGSRLFAVDLRDKKALSKVLAEARPEIIFHLAAHSSVFGNEQEIISNNVESQVNLFEAVKERRLDPVILIAGSALEYGPVQDGENPVKETMPLRPNSAYGLSKVKQEESALRFYREYDSKTIITRAFNHTGPGQQAGVVPSFSRQIARIEQGLQDNAVKVGNLEVVRDFTDVRDMVRAYYLAVGSCDFGEIYNIGSGKGYKIKDILDLLLSFSQEKIIVRKDQSLMRETDIPKLVADCSKFKAKTNWQPQIKIEQTIEDTLNFFRNEFKNKKN